PGWRHPAPRSPERRGALLGRAGNGRVQGGTAKGDRTPRRRAGRSARDQARLQERRQRRGSIPGGAGAGGDRPGRGVLAGGGGDLDVVLVNGFVPHIELAWEHEPFARALEGLASFARVITFDRRGSGLSDPVAEAPTLEQRMDDVRAVMDAAGSERAALMGISEGVPMSILFAATYPER